LENQEIAVCAERLTREALNNHGNALATTDARSRKTVVTGAATQFMKQREHQTGASCP
jgi:hypothetical protein